MNRFIALGCDLRFNECANLKYAAVTHHGRSKFVLKIATNGWRIRNAGDNCSSFVRTFGFRRNTSQGRLQVFRHFENYRRQPEEHDEDGRHLQQTSVAGYEAGHYDSLYQG